MIVFGLLDSLGLGANNAYSGMSAANADAQQARSHSLAREQMLANCPKRPTDLGRSVAFVRPIADPAPENWEAIEDAKDAELDAWIKSLRL